MEKSTLILVKTFCENCSISFELFRRLTDYGLIETVIVAEEEYVDETNLAKAEQMLRLHTHLQINFEGLDVISSLLEKIEVLEEEIKMLKRKNTGIIDHQT